MKGSVLEESLTILCRAIGAEALPVADVQRVEQWAKLPGFSVEGLRQLVQDRQKGGRKVSSARYFDGAVREAFSAPVEASPEPTQEAPRPLCLRPWREYLAALVTHCGRPDDRGVEALYDRWRWQRQALGIPIEETPDLENTAHDPELPTGATGGDPVVCAA